MFIKWLLDKKKKLKIYIEVLFHKKCLVLVNTPLHGNLGDQAIAYAEEQFLRDYFPDYKIIEIDSSLSVSKALNFYILSSMNSEAVFLIHAGGYLGDLWSEEESRIKRILSSIKENRKIILPQTYYVMNSNNREKKYHEDRLFYSKLKNLIVCLRDDNSYQVFSHEILCKSQCFLLPDIVTYLSSLSKEYKSKTTNKRNGVLFCMRRDHEKIVDPNIVNGLISWLKEEEIKFSYTDTCVDYAINKNVRKKELLKKWDEFSKAKLVITDRIHGMIFSALTGTPCIALDNVSKKVSGAYHWIDYLDYIKIIEKPTVDVIENVLGDLMQSSNNDYNNVPLTQYYDALAECIVGKGGKKA